MFFWGSKMKKGWLGLLFMFLEGFAVTWNPFTMALAIGAETLAWILLKPETTPLKNGLFLVGAFVGWLASYSTGGIPFYRWNGIWWMPTGLVVAAALGIPIMWYLKKGKIQA